MRELVALDMAPGPEFVDHLRRVWDDGDAVLPLDPRLPSAARAAVLAAGRPTIVRDQTGSTIIDGDPVEPGDAVVIATSGTTGVPKAAVLTHDAVEASSRITTGWLGVEHGDAHWLCCLPVAHIGGLSVITRAVHTGAELTVLPRFDAGEVDDAARAGATHVSLVVAALRRVDTSGFERILLGGSAIPAERPANTVATYGMTETGSGVVYDGRPLADVELRVVDGQIEVRSPTLLRCYRDGTVPVSADGWFATGDGGELSDGGVLSVTGRLGDVIVTGGEKVWPVVVERAIADLDLGIPVAVVGRPSVEWGDAVTAVFEVPSADSRRPPPVHDLRDLLRDALPGYALPQAIETTVALPRTELGKVRRNLL